MRILAIEDAPESQALINLSLKSKFEMDFAGNCAEALQKAKGNDYVCILIDIHLPDGNGFELFQKLKEIERAKEIPAIFLTADKEISSILMGLSVGADDYVTKPVNPLELQARVDSKVNKWLKQKGESRKVVRGPFEFDLDAFKVFADVEGKKLELSMTPIEFRLLLKMAHAPGHIFTRDMLIDQVWGTQHFIDERSVDKHISALRLKMKPYHNWIKTRTGLGYSFENQAQQ